MLTDGFWLFCSISISLLSILVILSSLCCSLAPILELPLFLFLKSIKALQLSSHRPRIRSKYFKDLTFETIWEPDIHAHSHSHSYSYSYEFKYFGKNIR